MKNMIIRETAKVNNVRLWEVAEALGMQDSAFSRKLRHELPRDEQNKIMRVIESLVAAKGGAAHDAADADN